MKFLTYYLLLALVTSSMFAMEPVDETDPSALVQAEKYLMDLPKELLGYTLLHLWPNITIMNCSLRQLRLTNKTFKSLIDDQKAMGRLMILLSKKINTNPVSICRQLKAGLPSVQKIYQEIRQATDYYGINNENYNKIPLFFDKKNNFIMVIPYRYGDEGFGSISISRYVSIALARFSSDFSLDTTFGNNGSIKFSDKIMNLFKKYHNDNYRDIFIGDYDDMNYWPDIIFKNMLVNDDHIKMELQITNAHNFVVNLPINKTGNIVADDAVINKCSCRRERLLEDLL